MQVDIKHDHEVFSLVGSPAKFFYPADAVPKFAPGDVVLVHETDVMSTVSGRTGRTRIVILLDARWPSVPSGKVTHSSSYNFVYRDLTEYAS